jgi:N-acetylneuraminate synthase
MTKYFMPDRLKVASRDLTNLPLLSALAETQIPIILSTGMGGYKEIEDALSTISRYHENISILHCVSEYPTRPENANLLSIKALQKKYPNYTIGYSDHTLPDSAMTSLMTAHLLGAVIIEKHFTHDKSLPGNDHYHAMDKHDLARFIALIHTTHTLLGTDDFKVPISTEAIARKNARRSIVVAQDIPAGKKLTAEDLTYKRPGTGISPLHWDEVLNRHTITELQADHILQWQDLSP